MGDSHENKEDEMADFKLSDGIKTFFLAGVGAVALTAEKSQEIIGELVKKGELTVEQGKELNKDLQRSFKETMDKKGVNIDELGQKISKMSADELAKIKEQIAAAEKIVSERLNAAGEDAEEAAEDAKESAEEIAEEVADTVEEVKAELMDAERELDNPSAWTPLSEFISDFKQSHQSWLQ